MLKVVVDLHPSWGGPNINLATVIITNTGSGDQVTGNYDVRLVDLHFRTIIHKRIEGYASKRGFGPLVAEAMELVCGKQVH